MTGHHRLDPFDDTGRGGRYHTAAGGGSICGEASRGCREVPQQLRRGWGGGSRRRCCRETAHGRQVRARKQSGRSRSSSRKMTVNNSTTQHGHTVRRMRAHDGQTKPSLPTATDHFNQREESDPKKDEAPNVSTGSAAAAATAAAAGLLLQPRHRGCILLPWHRAQQSAYPIMCRKPPPTTRTIIDPTLRWYWHSRYVPMGGDTVRD